MYATPHKYTHKSAQADTFMPFRLSDLFIFATFIARFY